MKPLPAAPLTLEDQAILWDWVEAVPGRRWDFTWEIWRESDRRDAALMLRVQTNRWAEIHDDGLVFDTLPPWLLPMTFDCGPVGGDIERYV